MSDGRRDWQFDEEPFDKFYPIPEPSTEDDGAEWMDWPYTIDDPLP